MRIGVDIDDVIFPWYERAHYASQHAGITNGVTPRSWYPFREYGCTTEAWLDALAAFTRGNCWLYNGQPFEGAAAALHQLKDAGHTIHIVTARGYLSDGPNVRAKTARWLDIWSIPHDTLTFSKDKTVVRTDWFVDDNADNIRAVNAAGSRGVLMHQTWNEDAHDLERVDTITAFAKTVLEEA